MSMRFSLRTAQLVMLAIVIFLGLPTLLPAELLRLVTNLMWQLVLVSLTVQVVFSRGAAQAFALGGLVMGALQLVQESGGADFWQLVSLITPYTPPTMTGKLILWVASCGPLISVYFGACIGRWIYLRQAASAVPTELTPPSTRPNPGPSVIQKPAKLKVSAPPSAAPRPPSGVAISPSERVISPRPKKPS